MKDINKYLVHREYLIEELGIKAWVDEREKRKGEYANYRQSKQYKLMSSVPFYLKADKYQAVITLENGIPVLFGKDDSKSFQDRLFHHLMMYAKHAIYCTVDPRIAMVDVVTNRDEMGVPRWNIVSMKSDDWDEDFVADSDNVYQEDSAFSYVLMYMFGHAIDYQKVIDEVDEIQSIDKVCKVEIYFPEEREQLDQLVIDLSDWVLPADDNDRDTTWTPAGCFTRYLDGLPNDVNVHGSRKYKPYLRVTTDKDTVSIPCWLSYLSDLGVE